ncbi:MAG: glycosyltransferase [Roseiarcus sp.]|jgi:GT2 family glycosyltransferase
MLVPPVRNFVAAATSIRRGGIVAIPVKDEALRLPACLRALAEQRDLSGRPLPPDSFRVVVFANNCTDGSAALARGLTAASPFEARVIERRLPPKQAHAGGARRAAMNFADAWSEPGGVILTTDADSRVPPDWIAANLAAIDAGVDAVLGRVALDEEGVLLPASLHQRGALESAYEEALTELSALLDPLEHDPWPRHGTISGASLAVTVEAYRRVGGLPGVPLGEDKALVEALRRQDARIRFAPEITVTTSARVRGRARGGVADTLRLRSAEPDALCDEALEPFRTAIRRAGWRGRLRRARRRGGFALAGDWGRALGIAPGAADRIARTACFGAAWRAIEAQSPALAARRLAPADLPDQIAGARRALARLRGGSPAARQDVEPEIREAVLTDDRDLVA